MLGKLLDELCEAAARGIIEGDGPPQIAYVSPDEYAAVDRHFGRRKPVRAYYIELRKREGF